ncbi:hypothetical protein B0J14DRAFT_562300 [Halenospora varia]|nr:hypothetical protein B0J14DRAFT_562300 [Halenospora varia]
MIQQGDTQWTRGGAILTLRLRFLGVDVVNVKSTPSLHSKLQIIIVLLAYGSGRAQRKLCSCQMAMRKIHGVRDISSFHEIFLSPFVRRMADGRPKTKARESASTLSNAGGRPAFQGIGNGSPRREWTQGGFELDFQGSDGLFDLNNSDHIWCGFCCQKLRANRRFLHGDGTSTLWSVRTAVVIYFPYYKVEEAFSGNGLNDF